MKYEVNGNKIVITGLEDFCIRHILECGQIFRFKKIVDSEYVVYFGREYARVKERDGVAVIETSNTEKAIEFFDLNADYSSIKRELSKHEMVRSATNQGHGIRILKNDIEEVIFSFIISANNNIKRIQKIVEALCEIGEDMGEYRAFPTAEKIANASDEFFASLHAGYRAPYLKKTAEMLVGVCYDEIAKMSTEDIKKWLMTLSGVGPKVASCILLFGFHRFDVFPVDTWVNKVYRSHFFAGERTRTEIEKYFIELFGDTLAGIAQQYLFFAERENGAKK